mmetsp:Transcript_5469/g.5632  ORF Transcript_5469/g.5632 Transcript_5469/m.5632 type:complete len:198 (+) Transcript_5469:180-773(+)
MDFSQGSGGGGSFQYIDEEAAICGYLHKKTKDGRWQRRWFETNGVYLTYYKSRKMEKLLAALSLPQVGEIATIPIESDPEHKGGLFELELKTRVYVLRAKSDEEAQIWVTALKQVRDQGQNGMNFTENMNNTNVSEPATNVILENTNALHNISASTNMSKNNIKESKTRDSENSNNVNANWSKEKRDPIKLKYCICC